MLGILPLLSRHAVKGYFQYGIFGAELLVRVGFQVIVVNFLFRPVNGQLVQLVLLPLGSFQSGQCLGVLALGKGQVAVRLDEPVRIGGGGFRGGTPLIGSTGNGTQALGHLGSL